jgi:hypothetical protein
MFYWRIEGVRVKVVPEADESPQEIKLKWNTYE